MAVRVCVTGSSGRVLNLAAAVRWRCRSDVVNRPQQGTCRGHHAPVAVRQASEIVRGYRALVAGRPEQLIGLLAADVEWWEGAPARCRVRGHGPVADLLARAGEQADRVDLRTVAIGDGVVSVEFAEPWWNGRPWLTRIASGMFAISLVQTVTFDEAIRRLSNRFAFTAGSLDEHGPRDELMSLRW
jgi:hypothetical protein